MNQNELMHFNIPGSHWGVRRYQNYDGSLTDEGRIRYGRGEGRRKKSEKDGPKETPEERKARILRSGTPAEILSIKGELTDQELTNARNRLTTIKQINDMVPKKKKITAGDVLNAVTSVNNAIAKGLENYEKIAKLLDEDDEPVQVRRSQVIAKDIMKRIGTMDAKEIKQANEYLSDIVKIENVANGKPEQNQNNNNNNNNGGNKKKKKKGNN